MDNRSVIKPAQRGPKVQRGVTLIELLVVLAILAFAAGLVVVNAPPSTPPARDAAMRFALFLEAAIDDTIINGQNYQIAFDNSHYRFLHKNGEEWVEAFSMPLDQRPQDLFIDIEIKDAAASNAYALHGVLESEDNEAAKTMQLNPFGVGSGFLAVFQSGGERWLVEFSGGAEIEVRRL